MATPTLDEVLDQPTVQEALDATVLPEIQAARDGVTLPVTDWKTGGVFRSLAYGVAKIYSEARTLISAFSAATFGDYVFGFVDAPGGMDLSSWATDRARDVYGITRIDASYTKRQIRFTNATAGPFGPFAAGALVVEFATTGNRYVNESSVTILAGPAVDTDAIFRSEYTVDSAAGRTYSDAVSSTVRLVTSVLPGVTVTNPGSTFSDVSQLGVGTGTVTPSGAPGAAHSYTVRIDTSGQVTVATWSYRIDGGAWVAAGAVAAVANVGGTGTTITLANGGGTPSFVAANYYYFANPGTDVTAVGRDEETPRELGTRCRGVMPLLRWTTDANGNFVPPQVATIDGMVAMTLTAFPEEVKTCFIRTGDVNDEVKIFVAGQGATLDGSTIARVQNYWDLFAGLTCYPVVASPSTQAITLAAVTVTVRASQLAAAQAAMQTSIATYLAGLDPRRALTIGDGLTVKVRRDYLISLITTAPGVEDMTDNTFTVNGAATDYFLAPDTMATWAQSVATAFTWSTI